MKNQNEVNLRALLKSHGNCISVDTAHEETKETADSEKLVEGRAVDGGNLKDTKDDHVEDHGPLATPFVSSKAKYGSTDGSEKESEGDGGGDVGLTGLVIVGQLLGLDGKGVEIKSISSPSGQSHEEKDPITASQLSHEADGVLDGLRVPPFRRLFAVVVGDDDTLLPYEEVSEGLFGSSKDAFLYGVGTLTIFDVGGHDEDQSRISQE